MAHIVQNQSHPFGAVEFDPTAKPGSRTTACSTPAAATSDSATAAVRAPTTPARRSGSTPWSARFSASTRGARRCRAERRDLATTRSRPANRFAGDGDPKTLGEIYAYGFRNAHRLSWDSPTGRCSRRISAWTTSRKSTSSATASNYGWMQHEGIFENGINRPGGALNQLFELPAEILDGLKRDDFIYPVAMYDHDEGRAISGGFAYNGKIPALRGKFVFGDVQRGRSSSPTLAALKKADDGVPRTVAPIEEIQLFIRDANGSADERVVPGACRSDDGDEADPRRSSHQPRPRRRAAPDLASGRVRANARAVNWEE